MNYFWIILGSYLLGTSHMAWYLAKLKKKNLTENGSGNLGTSNAAILLGWGPAVLVGIHDIGKAVLAVLLFQGLYPDLPYAGAAAGVAAVLGHIFPFWLKFKGGKGFASFLGMTIALDWKLAIVVLIALVLITVITDYLVLSTLTTIFSVPTYLGLSHQSWILFGILAIASAAILYKHRINLVRIRKGTEIGLRSTIRGEHRI